MKKAHVLKILNPVLAVLLLNQALSGIFHSVIQENLPYAFFKVGHGFMGYVFTALIIVHIILNLSLIHI